MNTPPIPPSQHRDHRGYTPTDRAADLARRVWWVRFWIRIGVAAVIVSIVGGLGLSCCLIGVFADRPQKAPQKTLHDLVEEDTSAPPSKR